MNYSAAKGGIVSLTWGLAWELQNTPITCNAIAPFAHTRMHEWGIPGRKKLIEAGLAKAKRSSKEELDRPGPEFVAPMVVYLASDYASTITGQVFRCGAGKIAVYTHPDELREINKVFKRDGPWTLNELIELVPKSLMTDLKPWWV